MRMALLVALLGLIWPAAASEVPERAYTYAPMLVSAQRSIWPTAPTPSFLAGLVEQESCVSLKSKGCWNPNVQLKTPREWGRGLGQVTTAYRADGSIRFDTQAELRQKYPSLRDWTIERWADPVFQLTAIVEMNKGIYGRQRNAATEKDRRDFTLSAYNGGEGGLLQDRRYCGNLKGCDPSRWKGHVERSSLKSKKPMPGYGGQSPYSINRGYVSTNDVRRLKYEPFWER